MTEATYSAGYRDGFHDGFEEGKKAGKADTIADRIRALPPAQYGPTHVDPDTLGSDWRTYEGPYGYGRQDR